VYALQSLTRKIVHDTNNYYGILQGYISLMETTAAGDEILAKYLPPMKEALQAGIDLNKRLSAFYRESPVLVADTDLTAVVREECAAFASEHGFRVEVVSQEVIEPIPLDEPAVRSLVGNLCLLAMKTGTTDARLELTLMHLGDEDLAGMVLDSRPGGYLCLLIAVSLADYPQVEATEFLNPFALEPDHSGELGLALLVSLLQNHGGNLDVTIRDHLLSMAIYFPQRPK
jgi:signal transduction histidine kinase